MRRNNRRGRRTATHIAEGVVIVGGCALIATAIYLAFIITNLPSPDEFNATQINQSTKIYDRTGAILLYEVHGDQKRTVVAFDMIPQAVKDATLAAEDASFYSEPAFNWKGILRALIANIREGRITQGGSTITQQLAKTVFLSPERTVTRKLKELVLAIQLESKYSKDEILGFYLNQIPFGSNAYGIEAASQTYFSKPVTELSAAEAATIASLIKAPSYYSPWGTHLSELLSRKDRILDRMVELGNIPEEKRGVVKSEALVFAPPSLGTIKAPHFVLAVKDYLVARYGEELVTNGGLKVITTLDWKLQEIAEQTVLAGVKRNTELYQSHNGALVAQDPKTGQVLALVGSKDYFSSPEPAKCTPGATCMFEGNFNVATQGLRQPGSALKPFVYMSAFQKGYAPSTQLFDVLTEFDVRNDPATSYQPHNFDNLFRGPVPMAQALAQSMNVLAVKTLYLAGMDRVLKNLASFGISTLTEKWRYGLSLTLGGGEVKLNELVNAYGTLAQDGIRHDQVFILSVSDVHNTPLEVYEDHTERVIEPQYPRLITDILKSQELRAPLYQSSLPLTIFPGHEVALKTGTTEDYRDAWAIGYTPSLVVGVWAGNNNNKPMVRQGSSILAAVPIWSAFLTKALVDRPSEPFTPPEPVLASEKPMLNGSYVATLPNSASPQVHTILYYVDRENPLGPMPENPATDSQFQNWEASVVSWARSNVVGFAGYNIPTSARTAGDTPGNVTVGDIRFDEMRPINGSYVTTPLNIQVFISSDIGLQSIEVSLNGVVINSFGITTMQYRYTYSYAGKLEAQNTIRVSARNTLGGVNTKTFVVYKTPTRP
ncbi:MAG: transglycosylase domain-containing protein [bacterium]|nr:transglycosylase domain-containing protein [bacterium]